jgi:Zn-dependent peptidase ImmA (M78 family)
MTPRAAGIEHARLQAALELKRAGVQALEHIEIERIAARHAIDLLDGPLDGATAQLVIVDGHATIVLSDRLTPPERRFSIAHELGHYVLGHPSAPIAELLAPRPRDHASDEPDHEAEADAFASELLMPDFAARPFVDRVPLNLHTADELAKLCRVSLVAAAIRITELTDQVCAVIASEAGAIRWAAPSRAFAAAFPTTLRPSQRLAPGTVAHGLATSTTILRKHMALIAAALWLGPTLEPTILEHSILIEPTGTVVTMLWVLWGPSHGLPPLGVL